MTIRGEVVASLVLVRCTPTTLSTQVVAVTLADVGVVCDETLPTESGRVEVKVCCVCRETGIVWR